MLVVVTVTAIASEAKPTTSGYVHTVRPALEKHCFDCHADEVTKGGIDLGRYRTDADFARTLGQFDAVLRAVREERMPPPGKGTLSPAERQALVTAIANSIDHAIEVAPKDPGRVVLHRLNRGEYNRTIRDLLGVDSRPADRFPADGGGGEGFTNTADTLYVPPLLIEKLIDAAEEVLAAAKPERVLTAKPTAETPKARRESARLIVAGFARRAFRRPVPAMELDRLLRPFDQAEKRGVAFEVSVRHMLKAVLVSPHFLYRVEQPKPGGQPYELAPHEIACRLSYFLWSSMPDDELSTLADEKKLADPLVIQQQVRRMLRDPKASALGEEFATQWLQVDRLSEGAGPDPARYRELTPALRTAMLAEPAAFFNALVARDRSLLDVVQADYAWVNEDLAAIYGIPDVRGPELREVAQRDIARRGVLGMAAVLAVTSHPGRTSPVLRGVWVLDRLLAEPPPPPPPDTPQLPKEESASDAKGVRARLEAHRTRPDCAACHARIDPIGFGLENFDPLGRWRVRDVRGEAIDARGVLPDGSAFSGPVELRALLLARRQQLARSMTEKLLAYALGRGLETYDRPTVTRIVAAAEADGWKVSRIILEVATSYPFRFARDRAPTPAAPPPAPAEAKP